MMSYVLIIFAAVLGYLLGKSVGENKAEPLYAEIQARDEIINNKEHEITDKDRKIENLEETLGYLQINYPAILELLEGRERSREMQERATRMSRNPALAVAYREHVKEKEREAIKKLSTNRSELKTSSQYEYEIDNLKKEIDEYKIHFDYAEIAGKYTLAFRNIVIEHADELKDEVKIISAINYDDCRPLAAQNVEIEFLNLNIPNYKYIALN